MAKLCNSHSHAGRHSKDNGIARRYPLSGAKAGWINKSGVLMHYTGSFMAAERLQAHRQLLRHDRRLEGRHPACIIPWRGAPHPTHPALALIFPTKVHAVTSVFPTVHAVWSFLNAAYSFSPSYRKWSVLPCPFLNGATHQCKPSAAKFACQKQCVRPVHSLARL